MNILKTIVYKITVLQVSINNDKKVILDCNVSNNNELRILAETQLIFHSSYCKFLESVIIKKNKDIQKYYENTKKYSLILLELSEKYEEQYYLTIAEKVKLFYEFSSNLLNDNSNHNYHNLLSSLHHQISV